MLVGAFIKPGSKRNIARLFFRNLILAADAESGPDVLTGTGKTAIAYNTATLTAYYIRQGQTTATAITLAAGTIGTWSSGGFIKIDDTNMPGLYEFGIPDAAVAHGADYVDITFKGITGVEQITLHVELIRSLAR